MPNIRPSADLRNHYNEISEFCHSEQEPVFITKNGKGDLVVMSMEVYNKLINAQPVDADDPVTGDVGGLIMSLGDNDPELGRQRLHSLLEEGFEDIRQGRTVSVEQAFEEIWDEINKEKAERNANKIGKAG